MTGKSRGAVLGFVLLILFVALTLVPLLVFSTHNEARWAVKNTQTTAALHLAEAGIERAYLELAKSSSTWQSVMDGGVLAGYRFDQKYSDLDGGDYSVWIGSGSAQEEAEVVAVGRDRAGKEIRSIRVVYGNSNLSKLALQSADSLAINGNNFKIHWGAASAPGPIDVDGRLFPQLWGGSDVDLDTNGAYPANCDGPNCCHWHSYNSDIPGFPDFNIDFYRSSATLAGTSPDPQCGSYYKTGNQTLAGCVDTTGNTFFIDGNLLVESTMGGNYIVGDVIVMGNMTVANGNWGTGSETVPLPQEAWKQYCQDWTNYRTTFDPGAPASWPGLASDYLSDPVITYNLGGKVFLHGFMYVRGTFGNTGGGGNGTIVGAVYIGGAVTLNSNSNATIYHDPTAMLRIKTYDVRLTRQSWQEETYPFPTGL